MHDPAMDFQSHIRSRLASLRLSPTREREIVEELVQHLEDRWRELVARGLTPEDAAQTARTEFSGARLEALLGTLRQAHWREVPSTGQSRALSMDSLLIDLRQAIRALQATPSFTIGALIVLALGTGATTAIFSVVDAVALRPLPFPEPDRIVAVGARADPMVAAPGGPQGSPAAPGKRPLNGIPGAKPPDPDALISITNQEYLEWSERQQVFESMAAITYGGETVFQRANSELEVVKGQRVTASFFEVLGVRPQLGSTFAPEHERQGSDRVAVVSDGFWRRYLGGDHAAIGQSIRLNDDALTIVGVMPARFDFPPGSPQPTDVWMPSVQVPGDRLGGSRQLGGVQAIARLRGGVSLDQAEAQMSEVAMTMRAANPAMPARSIGIRTLRDHLVGTSTRRWMLMLLAAVGIVLLIACANVANLWMARASVQQRDAAVRAALGASRARLVQRVLIDSCVVSIVSLVIGLAIARICIHALSAALPEAVARVSTIGLDARVFAVAAVVAVATGLVSGLAPALQAANPALSIVLSESSRGGGVSRGRRRARAFLVITEVALAVVLLVGAALFIGSFINVLRIDPGFRSEGVLAAQIVQRTGPSGQDDVRPALSDIVDRARQLPGVIDAAAAAPGIPFRIQLRIGGLQVPGQPIDYTKTVSEKVVTPSYHQALAIPLKTGRYFTDEDREGTEGVMILSDASARLFFGDQDPVGRSVIAIGAGTARRIVGVVANARQASLEVSPHPEIYLPMAQGRSQSHGFVLLRTTGEPNDSLPALRGITAQVLPGVPLRNIASLEDLFAAQTAERRLSMLMFSLFGILGLMIAAVGVFSVIAYLVSQQTRDIGIRMALGATRSRVVSAVFGQVGRLVAVGLVVGGFAAWSLSRTVDRFLFGLAATDVRAFALAMAALLVATFVATLLPARRAASIDPLQALRHE
jgi:predicted permease